MGGGVSGDARDARRGNLSAPLSERRLDAADVTVFVDDDGDVDVAEAREVVAERVGLLSPELEQERTAGPQEAGAIEAFCSSVS